MTETGGVLPQQRLLGRWVDSLSQLPAVEVIWLEGSLVDNRANPWSDIDLRIAVADEAYNQLWEQNRSSLLEGLGEHLVLWDSGFVRAVTAEGIIVELAVLRTSELEGQQLYEWKFLLNRLPNGLLHFQKLPERSTAETWPSPPVTVDDVRRKTNVMIHMLALAPQDFYRGERLAAAYTLDFVRSVLFQTMYQRLGIRFSKRAKELSQIFPADFLADLESTYMKGGESALEPTAVAAALTRTFAALRKHLHAQSEQVGGGFEPEWFDRLFTKMRDDIHRLVGIACDSDGDAGPG
jgi:hypothetical protein